VNRLTEALSQPTEEEIFKLVGRMLPRLCKLLPSPESFFKFVQALAVGVPAAAARLTEFGVEVFQTVPEGAVHRLSPQTVSETVDRVSIVSSGKTTSARLPSKRPVAREASRPGGEASGSLEPSGLSSRE
jgi:hypothetical protein